MTQKSVTRSAKPPTIYDVAARAGVSKSTVSNVLQGKVRVDDRTQQRVLKAIAELGYQPNAGARSLRQHSRVLGVLVGDLTNPFHAELAAHIEEQAALRQHSMLLVTTVGDPDREAERLRTLVEHRVAALLLLSKPQPHVLANLRADVRKVFVSINVRGAVSIAVDDKAGTELAVRHVAELGHTSIGFVSAMLADEPATEEARFNGFRGAMNRLDLKVDPAHLLRPHDAHPDTWTAMLKEFLSQTNPPTAIIASHDLIAIDIMSAADAIGLTVPEGLSLVGFDNIAMAGQSRIALSTVAQPMAELARLAVDAAISDPHGRRPSSVSLAPELVIRHSTAPPHKHRISRK